MESTRIGPLLKAIIYSLILLFVLPYLLHAQENCEWKEVMGEALADNITIEEAGRLALRKARLSAAEEAAGIHIYGGNLIYNSSLEKNKTLVNFIMTLSDGYIIKEEIIRWEAEFLPSSKDIPPIPLYKVYARCCVSKSEGEKDPFFTVSLKTNKPVFLSGDLAELTIQASRDSYITIFHLSSDDTLRILLPDQFQKKPFLKKDQELIFPSQGLGLKVQTSPSNQCEVEYFIVVATKDWFDFKTQFKKDRDIPITSFYMVLTTLPEKARAIAIGGYEVLEKD